MGLLNAALQVSAVLSHYYASFLNNLRKKYLLIIHHIFVNI